MAERPLNLSSIADTLALGATQSRPKVPEQPFPSIKRPERQAEHLQRLATWLCTACFFMGESWYNSSRTVTSLMATKPEEQDSSP
jgi:hypothetical protein